MRIFRCRQCDSLLFFENTVCLSCGSTLAFLPDRMDVVTLVGEGEVYRPLDATGSDTQAYRLCANYVGANVCNWGLRADSPDCYCLACRITSMIPQLDVPGNKEAWAKLETAKRRLIYTLLRLNLPLSAKSDDPERGLTFRFLGDPLPDGAGKPVLTGHDNGVITINVAEADDSERERRRTEMHEPYRTLLGHFRHEIGHYYWDRLIDGSDRLADFRRTFGDERDDYAQALQRHYSAGAPGDWADRFVTAYASSHPWEDWAETWAHYMHITDTLETASACGVAVYPRRPGEPFLDPGPEYGPDSLRFDTMIERWFTLTYVLNNLNRGMGLPDTYPFVLPPPAVEKLRFVHDVVTSPAAVLV